ncbi:dihydropteroate synthase [Porphyromonas sp. COT-290 OH860]|uniref:dihydropteroate synthase n=1 Tax=Porphyromonas sp. COT-290 OH860 TaxID=1515615 RepID=UPI00052E1B32|nr:dihydropteroate synthase [Porphyromonas sp. COT-290 OH860]KGN84356.1 dihydropteroate synthase [Porphyromonas sp. COT-290 OH860]
MQKQTLNLGGRLVSLDKPLVMGIVNVTPDSFYGASCTQALDEQRARIRQIIDEGGSIVDVGAYSSRPGADDVSPEEEKTRLTPTLALLRDEFPEISVSVDTFRADIAAWAVQEYGVQMINDISGGALDDKMFGTVARLQVPYILMHMRGTPQTMSELTAYSDLRVEILDYFTERIGQLRDLGLHDLIVDAGFGFGKTLEQNYELMTYLQDLRSALELPMLLGISRKSMIYRALDATPEDALNGTSVLHTYALLQKSVDILRVHDVRAAVECIEITQRLMQVSQPEDNPVEIHTRHSSY